MVTSPKYQVDFAPKRTRKLELDTGARNTFYISLIRFFCWGIFSISHTRTCTHRAMKKVIYSCDSPGIITTRIHYKAQAAERPLSTISEDSLCCHTLAAWPVHADASHSLLCLPRVSFAALHSRRRYGRKLFKLLSVSPVLSPLITKRAPISFLFTARWGETLFVFCSLHSLKFVGPLGRESKLALLSLREVN